MRKLRSLISVLLLSWVLVWGPVAMAFNYGQRTAAEQANYGTSSSNNVYSTVQTVIETMLIVIAFVFFGYTLYAGLRWLTARGNQEFVERAKGSLESSIIGIVIVMAAYAITSFVFSRF